MTKDDDFKLFRGFEDKRTDISGCRVVFATENGSTTFLKRRGIFSEL